jgi:CRP-like cAMP-binding protein
MANTLSNRMLDALPLSFRDSLVARMEVVELPLGTVLTNPGDQPRYAHFMTAGITSIVTFMSDGSGVEVGLIGREGLVEGMNMLGPAAAPTSSFVQVEGRALRIRYSEMQEQIFASDMLLRRVLESVQSQGFILGQLAACNGLHEIEERLARWLLMVRDRLGSDKFYLTQEFLAEMLGSRRTSVTLAAGSLQRSGLIHYRRGHIHILDADGLQSAACECYPIVRDLEAGLYRSTVSGKIAAQPGPSVPGNGGANCKTGD